MIEAVVDLFVERSPLPRAAALTPATRLLVVDASGCSERLAGVIAQLEGCAPVSAAVVGLSELEAVATVARFDRVWLVVGAEFDSAYASLIEEQLAREHREAGIERLTCGDDIPERALRGGLPWRRASDAARAARALAERITA